MHWSVNTCEIIWASKMLFSFFYQAIKHMLHASQTLFSLFHQITNVSYHLFLLEHSYVPGWSVSSHQTKVCLPFHLKYICSLVIPIFILFYINKQTGKRKDLFKWLTVRKSHPSYLVESINTPNFWTMSYLLYKSCSYNSEYSINSFWMKE